MSRFVSIGSVTLVALAPVACGNNQQPDRIEFRQSASVQQPQTALDGATVPKYVDAMPTFSNRRSNGTTTQNVDMVEFQQRILPASVYASRPAPFNAGSYQWGYRINGAAPSWPSLTIETHGTATSVNYRNLLEGANGARPVLARYLTVDQTVHWADPLHLTQNNHCVNGPPLAGPCVQPYNGPIPAVTHLHGAEVPSSSDGHPDAWWTPRFQQTGPAFSGTGFSTQRRHCASFSRSIRPARSSTVRCLEIAGRLMAKGSASSVTEVSPSASRARMARRVGSARAEKVTLRGSVGIVQNLSVK